MNIQHTEYMYFNKTRNVLRQKNSNFSKSYCFLTNFSTFTVCFKLVLFKNKRMTIYIEMAKTEIQNTIISDGTTTPTGDNISPTREQPSVSDCPRQNNYISTRVKPCRWVDFSSSAPPAVAPPLITGRQSAIQDARLEMYPNKNCYFSELTGDSLHRIFISNSTQYPRH